MEEIVNGFLRKWKIVKDSQEKYVGKLEITAS